MLIDTIFSSIYSSYFKTKKNSDLLEAFKLFDIDGDGKVSFNLNFLLTISLNDIIILYLKFLCKYCYIIHLQISLQDINDLISKLTYCGHVENTCLKTVINWASKNKTGNISLEVSSKKDIIYDSITLIFE